MDISYLPSEVGNLTKLKILCLTYNYLHKLPSEIGNLTNLKELYLRCNVLRQLPKELDTLNLDVFLIESNPVDVYYENIDKYKNRHR